MSSKISTHIMFRDFSFSKQNDKGNQKVIEMIRKPRERIQKLIKTQTEIVDMLTKNTKLQYNSFESKYVAFNQILDNFKTLDQVQYDMLFQVYTKADVNQQKKITKHMQFPETIEEMPQSNSLSEKKNMNLKTQKKRITTVLPKQEVKNEQEKALEKKQVLNKSQVKYMTQNRRMRKKQESYNENDSEQESNFEQKEGKRGKVQRYQASKQTSGNTLFFTGSNRYEQSRRTIKEKIQNNQKIQNQFNKIGQLLTLPYSVVQMLIDYNQSPQYPI